MIKVHLLEKIMQVVTNVSKWVAGIKNKKEEQCKEENTDERLTKKADKRVNKFNKKRDKKDSLLKVNKDIEQLEMAKEVHTETTKARVLNKSKEMKRWISFIKEENIIYLPSYSRGNQQQKLYRGDNVVYIDFDSIKHSSLKACYKVKEDNNKQKYGVKAHSRAPTHYLYISYYSDRGVYSSNKI